MHSTTTWGNAVHGATVLAQLGARRIALVTCDFHQRRALTLFAQRGFDAIGLSCASRASPLRWLQLSVKEAVLRGVRPEVP
jgi:uncharacterized SAM-binding protein YcdF (DUF218 family)